MSDRGSKEGKAILGIAEESEDWALKVIDFGTKPARPATRTKAVTGNHDTKMGMDFRKSSGARYSNVWFRATYIGNTEAASARSAHGLGHAVSLNSLLAAIGITHDEVNHVVTELSDFVDSLHI